jgi:transposase InsO family protein
MEPMARRVFMAELKADSLSVGRKRIARLMRAAGIAGVSRRRGAPVTTRQARDHHPASDLVRRNFMAERPNELWVADITFLPTLVGFLHLAVVLDAWSRRIVGWAFSSDLKTRVGLDALDMALAARSPTTSSIIPIAVRNTPQSPSALAARKPAFVHRQARSATPTTMRCARVSSPPSNAN